MFCSDIRHCGPFVSDTLDDFPFPRKLHLSTVSLYQVVLLQQGYITLPKATTPSDIRWEKSAFCPLINDSKYTWPRFVTDCKEWYSNNIFFQEVLSFFWPKNLNTTTNVGTINLTSLYVKQSFVTVFRSNAFNRLWRHVKCH